MKFYHGYPLEKSTNAPPPEKCFRRARDSLIVLLVWSTRAQNRNKTRIENVDICWKRNKGNIPLSLFQRECGKTTLLSLLFTYVASSA